MEERVSDIDWSRFMTAYGSAEAVEEQLTLLTSPTQEIAMKASHDLWCGLCHQHAYISTAALPAFPFIVSAYMQTDEKLKVEILDIFLGFATCLNRLEKLEKWQRELLRSMKDHSEIYRNAQTSHNEEISSLANEIIFNLKSIQQAK